MTLPLVTKEVCLAIDAELARKGIGHLIEGLENLRNEQPHLFSLLFRLLDTYVELHGTIVGESMTRMLVLMYKLIRTQSEVNELEE